MRIFVENVKPRRPTALNKPLICTTRLLAFIKRGRGGGWGGEASINDQSLN